MMSSALNKLKPGNKLSSEALLVILSIVSRITKDELVRIWWYSGVKDHFMSLLQDIRRFLPKNLPAASDVTKLKSQVDSHVDTLDRVLLQFNDVQVKGTESDQPFFFLDEVVSDIKEELSKLKKELANMIRIFGK
ncbi:uncharacterized protein LOC114576530 [Exaiptasia diaphana]|uniref:Uncharacterized protein n=1 Tax=Exaiptasia diaphana TaxID=2652724 RepID=A0A913YVN0_EXADI|nr:uncharacterized protein LOC114576530 [Exaiptasia diaphana]